MPTVTKDQMKKLIEGRPQGITPDDVINGVIKRGYTVEGLDSVSQGSGAVETSKTNIASLGPDMLKGAVKGVISTVTGLSGLGERALKGIGRAITPKQFEDKLGFSKTDQTSAEKVVPEVARTPQNTGEKIGYGIEQVGEFFIPETKIAKAVKATEEAAKVAGLSGRALSTLRVGVRAALEGTSATGVISAQEGKVSGNAVLVGGLAAGLSAGLSGLAAIAPSIASKVQKTSLRLSPSKQVKLGTKIQDVVDFLNKEKIVGSPETRVEKLSTLVDDTENTIQKFLNETASDRTINKQELVDAVDQIKDKYLNDRDYDAIVRQVDSVVKQLETQFPDEISVADLNVFKRSTMKGAFNKAGEKVLDGIEYDIGNTVYSKISEAVKDLKINGQSLEEFNARYGTILNTKTLLTDASTKRQAGPMFRILLGMLTGVGAHSTGAGIFVSPTVGLVSAGAAESLAKYRNVFAALAQTLSGAELQQFVQVLPSLINTSTRKE